MHRNGHQPVRTTEDKATKQVTRGSGWKRQTNRERELDLCHAVTVKGSISLQNHFISQHMAACTLPYHSDNRQSRRIGHGPLPRNVVRLRNRRLPFLSRRRGGQERRRTSERGQRRPCVAVSSVSVSSVTIAIHLRPAGRRHANGSTARLPCPCPAGMVCRCSGAATRARRTSSAAAGGEPELCCSQRAPPVPPPWHRPPSAACVCSRRGASK